MTIIDQSWYKRPPDIPKHHSAGGVIVRLENNHRDVGQTARGFTEYGK